MRLVLITDDGICLPVDLDAIEEYDLRNLFDRWEVADAVREALEHAPRAGEATAREAS